MDPRAIDKARSRLRTAERVIQNLEDSKTSIEFGDHWYVFLTTAKNVYTVLQQGAKVSPQSRQWFGSKEAERRRDELLHFIFQARNDDEHGLGSSLQLRNEQHVIGGGDLKTHSNAIMDSNGNIAVGYTESGITFEGHPPAGYSVRSLDGKPVHIEITPAHLVLIAIEMRDKSKLPPPKVHLGEPLKDTSPLAVARLAYKYLAGLVEDSSVLS